MSDNLVPTATFTHVHNGDITLRLAHVGTGPLVLMVHGFPEAWFSWRHQMKALADAGYTAAAFDTRGYGGSSKPAPVEAYTMAEMTGDICAVIDALSDGPAVLIGHDWGAPQVYSTALIHPDKVRAVVGLSVPAPPYSDKVPDEFWPDEPGKPVFYRHLLTKPGTEKILDANPEEFLRRFYYALSGLRPDSVNGLVRPAGTRNLVAGIPDVSPVGPWLSEEELAAYVQSFAAGFRGGLNRYRAAPLDRDTLSQHREKMITQPALFIGGGRDPIRTILGTGDRYADPLARCTDPRGAHIIEGAGHWLQQEAPDEVNALLLAFLSGLEDAR